MNKFRQLENFFITIMADFEVAACYARDYGPAYDLPKLIDASNHSNELAYILKELGKHAYSNNRKEYFSDLVTNFYSFKNSIITGLCLLRKTADKLEMQQKILLTQEQFSKIERFIELEIQRDSGPAI